MASRVWLAINTDIDENINAHPTHINQTSTMENASSSPKTYKIAVIPGDGIGIEVIESGEPSRINTRPVRRVVLKPLLLGLLVLQTLSRVMGSFSLDLANFDWSSEKYKQTGAYMPDDFLEVLRPFDAIFFGAGVLPSTGMQLRGSISMHIVVGDPTVPDHISLWSLLLPLRQQFQQYVNLRPVRILRGLSSPLSGCKPVR